MSFRAALALSALTLAAAAPAAGAQAVLLQVKPRLGDTLRMQLDQKVEMSGTSKVRGAAK